MWSSFDFCACLSQCRFDSRTRALMESALKCSSTAAATLSLKPCIWSKKRGLQKIIPCFKSLLPVCPKGLWLLGLGQLIAHPQQPMRILQSSLRPPPCLHSPETKVFVVCLLSIWLFVIVQVYHLNNVLLLVLLLHHVFIHLILRAVLFQVDFVISQVNNLCNIIITQFTYKSPLPLSDEHW